MPSVVPSTHKSHGRKPSASGRSQTNIHADHEHEEERGHGHGGHPHQGPEREEDHGHGHGHPHQGHEREEDHGHGHGHPHQGPEREEDHGHGHGHPHQGHEHGQGHPAAHAPATNPLVDVATIISLTKHDLKSNIHHQPKVSEHRGDQQRARNRASVLQIFSDGKPGQGTDEKGGARVSSPAVQGHKSITGSTVQFRRNTDESDGKRSLRIQSVVSTNRMGRDDRSSGSGESEISASSDKMVEDEDGAWDLFLDNIPVDEDDELMETSPLYEMANVEIEVEDALEEMEEALRFSLEQGRISDRERTVLLDKFGLFLQALVSFQENEVELIDHIGMKAQIMEVLNVFTEEENKATEIMIADQKAKDELNDYGTLDLDLTKTPDEPGAGEEGEPVSAESGSAAIDEMGATTIRENLLLQKNKLEMQEQMKIIHVLEIKQLEFEKTLLTMHYSKMIKPTDLQKEMRELRKTITDMKIEIGTMQQEIAQLQLDIAAEEKVLRDEEAEVSQMDLDTLSKQIEVTQNSAKPAHLQKDADREAHKLEQLQDVLQELNERWMAGMGRFRVFQAKIDQRNSEYSTLLKEEARMNATRKQAQQEADRVLADIETLQKKEQGLLNKCRINIEKTLYNSKLKKKLYEDHHTMYNETTRAQREHQKLERTIKLAREAHLNVKLAHEKMRSAFDAMQPKGDSDNWEKLRRMFVHEIENLRNVLDKSFAESSFKAALVIQLQKKLNTLYEEQVQCGKELQDMMRTTVRKRRERQDKAEQCIKLEAQLFAIVTDVRMKKIIMDDCARNERDLNRSIIILQKQYSQIKIEKASVVNDLIQARQRITEQTEKFKIAYNEVESYVNQSLDRTREITRIHYLLLNAGLARDSVRNDALRAVQKFRVHRIERDELKMANENMRKEVARLRRDVTDIRNRFESAIETSVKVAMSVRERTEEVCTFIERIQAYDVLLLKATAELRLRELEKSKLLSCLNEVKTHLIIVTSNEPDESKYVEKVETLRLRFYEVTKERRFLEDELSNITRPGRVRALHHNWIQEREQVPHLRKKINKLECLLATREVRILDRGLTLKQVEQLTGDSMERASYLKQRYECEVKYLVGMRKTLYHLSKRIDGMICETSLAVSRAEAAEIEYMRQKKEYMLAERRFELGYSPSREMQDRWNRKFWREDMLCRSKSRSPGFLVNKPRPTGAGVVMERFRPKFKCRDKYEKNSDIPFCNLPTFGSCCPKFPYKPKHRKLSCIKPVLPPLKTGLRVCHPSTQMLKLKI